VPHRVLSRSAVVDGQWCTACMNSFKRPPSVHTFRWLPLVDLEPLGGEDPTVSSDEELIVQSLDKLYVLAVEDVADSREVLVLLLEAHGARVTAVATAQEALGVLDRERPDVVVSDITMPGESGIDLIRKVRERPKEGGGDIPAVALTALTSPEARAEILAAGFQAHLGKPVESDDLVTVIRAVTGIV
jgi:CheY-like chemotaxis protein